MNILITGANGFIGRALCKRLLADGYQVGKSAAIDRLLGSLTIDSTKIRRELEWKPPYTMEQGIRETAKWYQKAGELIS